MTPSFHPSSKPTTPSALESSKVGIHEKQRNKNKTRSLHVPSVIPVRTVASIPIGGVSQESLVDHCLDGFGGHVVWGVGVVDWSVWSSSGCRCHAMICLDHKRTKKHEVYMNASERQSEPQPTPSPPHLSADQYETQPDPSPRPLPTILDSIPEGSGRNHEGQSSSNRSLSGNEDGLTL
ncbi:hypothetical protein Tco_0012387 [Tanacetum coccineum]